MPDRSSRLTLLEKIFGLAAALLALIVAIMGFYSVETSDQAKEPTNRVTTPQGPQPPNAFPTSGGSPAIRHSGRVTLGYGGEYVDLNAPASDIRWGASHVTPPNTPDHINYWLDALFVPSVQVLRLEGEKANYATCSTKAGFTTPGSLKVNFVDDSGDICLLTNSGRYATVKMVKARPKAVTIEITTWEKF